MPKPNSNPSPEEKPKPEVPLNEMLNAPEPFDPSLFGDVSDVKLPPTLQPAPVDPSDLSDEDLLNSPPKLDCKKSTGIAMYGERVRQTVVQVLKQEWPAAYERYHQIKHPVPGVEPTLAVRTVAYQFAWRAFLALTYRKSLAES